LSIAGVGVGDVSSIVADLATKPAEVFRASDLRRDVQRVSDVFSDEGYAFANVEPVTDIRPEERLVDIAFAVDKGRQVYIDRIDIAGNVKTRDKVVRRELKLQEQELFSATKLRTSREALQRLGFFQEVNITTRRSAADDRVNVVVDVKEGQTGAFSAGAGYSSADRILFNARVSENNLFGRGQRIVLNGDLGSIRRNIILSFTEPYLFDTPLTLGLDAFSWRLLFDEFTRDGTGFSTRTLYPLTALGFREVWGLPLTEVRAGFDYRLERAKIQDLGFGATRSIRLEEGSSVISSVAPRLLRNTLNHAFDPTAGSFQDLSLEFAGLGGDTSFLKAEARSRWYYSFWRSPRFGTFTYALGGTVGYGLGDEGIGGNELPLFERYFPGGLSSIRGFKARTLGPREIRKNVLGQEIADTPIGGSRELVVNNEVIFPIAQALGLKGVMFFDAGNAFTADAGYDIGDLRYAVGGGVRWLSPLGPLRVELGLPLNREPREDKSVVLFSFGGPLQ
jgi:outer membrane protein insertion porin family